MNHYRYDTYQPSFNWVSSVKQKTQYGRVPKKTGNDRNSLALARRGRRTFDKQFPR